MEFGEVGLVAHIGVWSVKEVALTMADSSDEEPLVRPVSGRNVVRRVGTPPPVVATARTVADSEKESGFVVQRIRGRGGLVLSTPATVPPVQANRFSPLVARSNPGQPVQVR